MPLPNSFIVKRLLTPAVLAYFIRRSSLTSQSERPCKPALIHVVYLSTNTHMSLLILNFRKLVTLRSGPWGPNQRSFRDMSGLCVSLYLSIGRRAGVYVLFIKHMISLAHMIKKKGPRLTPFCMLVFRLTPRPFIAEKRQCGLSSTQMNFVVNMFVLLSCSHGHLSVY